MTLLWLGDTRQAEPHLRKAITAYQTQPPLLQSSANHQPTTPKPTSLSRPA